MLSQTEVGKLVCAPSGKVLENITYHNVFRFDVPHDAYDSHIDVSVYKKWHLRYLQDRALSSNGFVVNESIIVKKAKEVRSLFPDIFDHVFCTAPDPVVTETCTLPMVPEEKMDICVYPASESGSLPDVISLPHNIMLKNAPDSVQTIQDLSQKFPHSFTATDEVEEYMASLYKPNGEAMNVSQDSDASSDDIEIIRELKVTLDEHQCDLCCKGSFLVDRLLHFGGLEHKYACETCLKSFKTKALALKHAKEHEGESARNTASKIGASPVVDVRTGLSVIEATTISEASTSTKETETPRSSTAESDEWCCKMCLFKCKSEIGWKRHNTNQHGVTYTCSVCGTNFKNLKKFKQHCSLDRCSPPNTVKLTDANPPKLIGCPTCHKNFVFKKSYEDHVCSLVS